MVRTLPDFPKTVRKDENLLWRTEYTLASSEEPPSLSALASVVLVVAILVLVVE